MHPHLIGWPWYKKFTSRDHAFAQEPFVLPNSQDFAFPLHILKMKVSLCETWMLGCYINHASVCVYILKGFS